MKLPELLRVKITDRRALRYGSVCSFTVTMQKWHVVIVIFAEWYPNVCVQGMVFEGSDSRYYSILI